MEGRELLRADAAPRETNFEERLWLRLCSQARFKLGGHGDKRLCHSRSLWCGEDHAAGHPRGQEHDRERHRRHSRQWKARDACNHDSNCGVCPSERHPSRNVHGVGVPPVSRKPQAPPDHHSNGDEGEGEGHRAAARADEGGGQLHWRRVHPWDLGGGEEACERCERVAAQAQHSISGRAHDGFGQHERRHDG